MYSSETAIRWSVSVPTVHQVIQEANGLQDGLVLCTYKLSDMIYQELAECLPPGFEMIVISTKDQWNENGTSGIVGLSVPLKIHELLSTVEMVSYNLERKRRKRRMLRGSVQKKSRSWWTVQRPF